MQESTEYVIEAIYLSTPIKTGSQIDEDALYEDAGFDKASIDENGQWISLFDKESALIRKINASHISQIYYRRK